MGRAESEDGTDPDDGRGVSSNGHQVRRFPFIVLIIVVDPLFVSLVPAKSRGAALLALTGDTEFNRHVRGKALGLGLHLNEFGLWRWRTGNSENVNVLLPSSSVALDDGGDPTSERRGYWELVRAETEEEILDELGMSYIEPDKRNFSFLFARNGRRVRR